MEDDIAQGLRQGPHVDHLVGVHYQRHSPPQSRPGCGDEVSAQPGEKGIDIEFLPMDFSTEQEDYDKLDKVWAEEPVTFGGGCSTPDYGSGAGESVVQFIPRVGSAKAAVGSLGA